MPASIAIQVQGLTMDDSQSQGEQIKQASSYIPRSNMPAAQDDTDWMSSSCGETPYLTDDIRDWRTFRLRIRKGSVNDHLEGSSSNSSETFDDEEADTSKFGDFYYEGDAGSRTRSDLGEGVATHLSSSVPIRSKPKFQVGSCPAVVINLPSLTPVANEGSELMKQNVQQRGHVSKFETVPSPRKPPKKEQEQAANTSADDSIFDLEM